MVATVHQHHQASDRRAQLLALAFQRPNVATLQPVPVEDLAVDDGLAPAGFPE